MSKLCKGQDGRLLFYCPGCECYHCVWTKEYPNPYNGCSWDFNGNFESPTITPSILVRHSNIVCHLFIENGKIKFLNDCTHNLAGITVDLLCEEGI